MMSDCCPCDADTKAVKTGTIQTQVIDGFQILRSEHANQTMLHLVDWTKALKRKYNHLTVSASTGPGIARALLLADAVFNPYTVLQMISPSWQYIGLGASARVTGLQKAHVESTVILLHIRHYISDSPESVFGRSDCTSNLLISWT